LDKQRQGRTDAELRSPENLSVFWETLATGFRRGVLEPFVSIVAGCGLGDASCGREIVVVAGFLDAVGEATVLWTPKISSLGPKSHAGDSSVLVEFYLGVVYLTPDATTSGGPVGYGGRVRRRPARGWCRAAARRAPSAALRSPGRSPSSARRSPTGPRGAAGRAVRPSSSSTRFSARWCRISRRSPARLTSITWMSGVVQATSY